MGIGDAADDIGILTMAIQPDAIIRACALAASIKIHEPTRDVCLLTTVGAAVPHGWFDDVIRLPHPEPFEGELLYLNKLVHPFVLTPFERTLFLDDDTLLVRPIGDVLERWFVGHELAINTRVQAADDSRPGTNHLDPSIVCTELGVPSCVNTYGGGHMYFEGRGTVPLIASRACNFVVEDRERYERWALQSIVSDELALLAVINDSRLSTPTIPDFVDALSLSMTAGAVFDVRASTYELAQRTWGVDITQVRVLHFVVRQSAQLRTAKRFTTSQACGSPSTQVCEEWRAGRPNGAGSPSVGDTPARSRPPDRDPATPTLTRCRPPARVGSAGPTRTSTNRPGAAQSVAPDPACPARPVP